MMEYWNDVEDKKTKILLYPLFHYSNIPLFQLRSEAELSSFTALPVDALDDILPVRLTRISHSGLAKLFF
jgi:hypothetical protein